MEENISAEHNDAPTTRADRSGVQVIARAAALLRALKAHPDGLTLGELARLLALPRSTVQRIVDALHAENLVIAASLSRGVRLGPALISLGAATRFEIAELARPMLQQITRECGETVDLSLLDGDRVVFVDQVAGVHRLRAESDVGIAFALHSSAPGKAMLAAMTPERLQNLRPTLRFTRLTRNTIVSWATLEQAISAIRETGIATDLEENSLGICAIAAALRLPNGELAAISIPVPTQRFVELRVHLEALLRDHCSRLQQRLGGNRNV
ncbi:IclR family transcriptional regulator [Pararobbsia silviterrae]|uniref:IclR family transcriptional regulator n=1 Tax=Pararobbsia silviterrae TaxID=1792498 RepID=UPI001314305F|nr:IclR family transcriptional regulator [Pararobbsia silviterrae]